MPSLVLLLLLAQPAPCGGDAGALMREASSRAAAFDLAGAAEGLRLASAAGCQEAEVAASYVAGLQAAREAYRFGGHPDSLAPVIAAERALALHAARGNARAEIARVVLLAAAAAAQSERGDLGVLLEHAKHLEASRLALRASGAPLVTAYEVAGDLWLQVHRFEDARAAYRAARDAVGSTPRVIVGLARTARRLKDTAGACESYRALARWWDTKPVPPQEVLEARAFLESRECARSARATIRDISGLPLPR